MTLRPFSATLQKNIRDQFFTQGAPEVIDDAEPMKFVGVVGYNFDELQSLYVHSQGLPQEIAAGSVATQTLVNAVGSALSTGGTVYTVTTGNNFRCFGFTICTGSGTGGIASIQVDGVKVWEGRVPLADVGLVCGGAVPVFFADSGSVITVVHGFGAGSGYVTLFGYEVPA